ncbi:MAG: hypothetical protein ABJG86_13275 [Nitratireductor sp.]
MIQHLPFHFPDARHVRDRSRVNVNMARRAAASAATLPQNTINIVVYRGAHQCFSNQNIYGLGDIFSVYESNIRHILQSHLDTKSIYKNNRYRSSVKREVSLTS